MIANWFRAIRPRTLPVTLAAVGLGSLLAAAQGKFSPAIALLTLITALLLQILSNLANDYGDSAHGADSDERTGPARSVQSGEISAQSMKKAVTWTALLAFLSGCILLYISFHNIFLLVLFLLLGLGAIWAAIYYTAGASPYGYAGWGDLAVFVFFGLLGTGGSYFLQTRQLDWPVLLPSAALGLLTVAVLNINNLRDMESDRKAGKHTLPVRMGKPGAISYHWALLWLAMLLSVAYCLKPPGGWEEWLFLLITPALIAQSMGVRQKSGRELDPYLKQTAFTLLIFALLFGLGQILIIEV